MADSIPGQEAGGECELAAVGADWPCCDGERLSWEVWTACVDEGVSSAGEQRRGAGVAGGRCANGQVRTEAVTVTVG